MITEPLEGNAQNLMPAETVCRLQLFLKMQRDAQVLVCTSQFNHTVAVSITILNEVPWQVRIP